MPSASVNPSSCRWRTTIRVPSSTPERKSVAGVSIAPSLSRAPPLLRFSGERPVGIYARCDGVSGKSHRELSAPQSWPVRETEVGCGRWRSCARHATTTTCGVMTGWSLPVYSGGLAENAAEPKEAPMNEDTVGGYAVPVDPMDLLQCDSCQ